MPLSINVGLSRKASKDYQSTGYSINVTAELDQTLLAKPDELQRQVDDLFAQAQSALDRQAGVNSESGWPGSDDRRPVPHRNGNHARNGNGYANGARNGNSNGRGGAAGNGDMTASQRRAVLAIARRLNIDADREAIDIVGVQLDALTLRQASDLIDHLRSLQPANAR